MVSSHKSYSALGSDATMSISSRKRMSIFLMCLVLSIQFVHYVNARPGENDVADKTATGPHKSTAINNANTRTCKAKDGTKVTCGPCEKCSSISHGCVSTCSECEECQAGVCVFAKPGFCHGPGLSKCYKAGRFFHPRGIC